MAIDLQILRPGNTARLNPYTIAFVANPVLQDPAGALSADPITSDKFGFDACVLYAIDCIFGLLPGQGENMMSDPTIGPNVRVVSIRETGLPATSPNSLVEERILGSLITPRRTQIQPYLQRHGLEADVVLAVSKSSRFSRASAWGTTDDTARGGTGFTIDGAPGTHWHFPLIQGTAAIHVTARSLTPAHEFGHAASSYTSGFITDLYVPHTSPDFNVRLGRPVPVRFATYNGAAVNSDPVRDSLGYPPGWNSYHPALVNAAAPALMDNYTTQPNPLVCRHDQITRAYLMDRLIAKIGR